MKIATTLMGKRMTMRLVMMITIKSVVLVPTRVSIAEDQSVVAVPSLTNPPPVLFRTKQMSNISYSSKFCLTMLDSVRSSVDMSNALKVYSL